MIPMFLFGIIGNALLEKRDVYQDFLDGAEDGLKTVVRIVPTLVGLMVATGILRASGLLGFLGEILGVLTEKVGMPGELMPLALVRMFSSSAAVGLLLDLFQKYGADSSIGWMAALILGATESVFYCISVYFGAIKIKRTGYTLAGALLVNLVGIAGSVWVVRMCFGGKRFF